MRRARRGPLRCPAASLALDVSAGRLRTVCARLAEPATLIGEATPGA
jgi:hypothetical protein